MTISGNTSIVPAEDTRYVCTAGLANPEATLAWTIQDVDGEDVPYTVTDDTDNTSTISLHATDDVPYTVTEDDVNISTITLHASDAADKIHITCVADNAVGQARHTRVVHVESKTSIKKVYV